MRDRLNILLLTLLTITSALAQPYCDVRTFTLRDGLAASSVSRFDQTPDGMMWCSTWNGLCCYDGYRFTTFRNQPGVSEVLTTNRIFLIRHSVTGDVWCCTYDRHIYLFDTRTCRFVNVSEMISRRFGQNVVVRNVYSLANGKTWIVSNNNGANFRIDDATVKDGRGIEMFSEEAGNLRSNRIKKIELDADGREWIFDDRGVLFADGSLRSDVPFEYFGLLGRTVMLASPDGRVYTCGQGARTLRRLAMPPGVGRIHDITPMDTTAMLFATDGGVVAYSIAGGRMTMKTWPMAAPGEPMAAVREVYADSRRRIWAFTDGEGIVMTDTRNGVTRRLMARAVNMMLHTTSDRPFFHEDRYGTIWTIPAGGTFSYYDEAAGQLVPHVLKSQDGMGVAQPEINKFFIDAEKNLWFTGTLDANIVNFKFHHFRHTPVSPHQDVRSLLVDSRGRTWAGTYNGQIAVYEGGRLAGYVNPQGGLQTEPTAFANRIYALREDSRGRIWVGTKGSGLFVIGRDGGVTRYVHNPSDRYSLSHDDIYDIDIDRRGRIWVASFEGGVNLVDERADGRLRFINSHNEMSQYPDSLYFKKIRRITHDGRGAIILSTSSGLITFSDDFSSPGKIRFHTSRHVLGNPASLMANDVQQTLVTRSGRIVVATMGGGVQEMVSDGVLKDNLRFRSLTTVRPDESIVQSLTEDNRGNIWIIRESSIEKYSPKTGSLSQYGPGNIGYDVEMSEARPVHNPVTDDISVAVYGGFITFRPADLKKSVNSPNIVFTGVLYQGDSEMEPLLNKRVLDVPSDRRNLTVYFAALEYSDKYLVKYAYKLDGVDGKWNYVGAANSASFNYLPAGRYKLLVKSTNCDGVWMDNVAELEIYAHPTFWETGWARLLYVLLFCGVICLIVYIYNLRSRAAMEREMSELKTKFFTEISHNLRTPLTLIGAPVSEVLNSVGLTDSARRHLEMVQRNASRMLELVNKMLRYSMEKGVYISDDRPSENSAPASAITPPDIQADASADMAPQQKREHILVVEDNDDVRDFLVSILQDEYNVLAAENGRRGLEIAETEMPEFIITDVMMPVMDGLTMVHRIKQNKDICHIPIIVLSAKASLQDRLDGLREGIDDYITKPFSAIYLKSRVSNIIRQRHLLQQAYLEQIKPEDRKTYSLEAPQIVDADNEMMNQLLGYLEEHISDASLKIDDLADAVNLGRSVFYGKIKSIVGMTPVDFVRHIRMQRAEQLIAGSTYPFSQIAYMVGFSDPKYFGKCFKKETGMTPSEYREKANGTVPAG
ncbi:MAG: response regulator [Prevotella sp.]|nr:response regulator [Prevotella sp.]